MTMNQGNLSADQEPGVTSPMPLRRDFLRLASWSAGAVLVGGGVLTACGGGGSSPSATESAMDVSTVCVPSTFNLTAGQYNVVGTVTVWNDATTLYVKYSLNSAPPYFGTLHLWIGDDLSYVPSNPQGTPVPGQFRHHFDATGLSEYTFAIPFPAGVCITTPTADYCGKPLYIVAHAEVGTETAFGGNVGHNIETSGRWWFHFVYNWCCSTVEPPPEMVCNTAFAKGGYVFTTDPKSNPELLPSLKLTKNRWGWAIKLTSADSRDFPVYAGAGLNNVAKGTLVGTLHVTWNADGTGTAVYTLAAGNILSELHLYAAAAVPTTVAPGQYGQTAYFDEDDQVGTATLNFNVTGACLWLIAHAVVCYPA